MKRLSIDSVFKWFFVFAVIVFMPLIITAKKTVHNFDGKCDTCHMSTPPDGRHFVKEIDFLCIPCHPQTGPSHPSGIKPSMKPPAGFQLDWAGRMTCSTCHDVHGQSESLLKGQKPGKMFCFKCHKGLDTSHSLLPEKLHTRENLDVTKMSFAVTNTGSDIDRTSKECLGCHDGALGTLADVSANVGSGIWNHGNGVSHPIGVDYMDSYRRKGKLVPIHSVNSAIKFYNGKVGCGSCHSVFAGDKFKLALPMKGSALCFACHNL
ncbi:MAG: cytochrome c3 family protein [Nitrospirae bacterium]|nr:cytochrome c3 family protein [Nitrospirota bacterium]